MPATHIRILDASIIVDFSSRGIDIRIGRQHVVVLVGAVFRVCHHALEPLMALAGMIEHEIHVNLDALGMGGIYQRLEIGLSAVQRVQGSIVVHMIRVGGMRRAQPQGRNAQGVQVIQLVLDTLEVTDAVTVTVGKTVNEQLVGGVGALGAVEGGRSGHQGLPVGTGLRHAHRSLAAAGDKIHRADARFSLICSHGNAHGAISVAGGGVQFNPVRCRHSPVPGGFHLQELGGGIGFRERQRSRTHREPVSTFRWFFLVAASNHCNGCD